MTRTMKASALIVAGLLTAGSASAAITYVDAQFNVNTFLAPSANGGASGGTITTVTTDTGGDNIWRARTGLGIASSVTAPPSGTVDISAGTVYESHGNNTPVDDVPRVVTTISGLTLNTYDVYFYFWSDQAGSPWQIRAGLTDDVNPLPVYLGGTAPTGPNGATSGTGVPVQIAVDPSSRKLFQVNLGQVTGTSFSVFIDDLPATDGNSRSWYDGVGYQVVPEPSTLALAVGGLAGLTLIRRKRA